MCESCGEHEPGRVELRVDSLEHSHAHDHGHAHGHARAHDPAEAVSLPPRMGVPAEGAKDSGISATVTVSRASGGLLNANNQVAAKTRAALAARGILMLNITAGAGSGKTALLQATLRRLPEGSAAVLVGDLETDRDAGRLHGLGAAVLQINTGKGCHLSASQVAQGLERLDLEGVKTVFVENVGNMACPSDYDLGEHVRVAVLSLPEGDDKAAKYPGLFAAADVVLLNKIDLANVLPFDESLLRSDLARLNTHAPLLRVSAIGGQGMEAWMEWIEGRRKAGPVAGRA